MAEQLHHLKVCSQPRQEKIPTFYLRKAKCPHGSTACFCFQAVVCFNFVNQACSGVRANLVLIGISIKDSSILTHLRACLLWHLDNVFVLQKGK